MKHTPAKPSPTPQAKRPTAPTIDKHDEKVVALEALLTALTAQHQRLLDLAAQHKAAIAAADVPAMQAVITQQAEAVRKVAELEKTREALITAMGFATPKNARPATLTMIASTLAEPARSRLSGAAHTLRSLIERLAHEQKTVQTAAESVATHLDGIMSQIAQRLSSAGTYARGGNMHRHTPLASSIDIRS